MIIRNTVGVLMVLLVAACSGGENANEQVQANSEMMENGMMPNGTMANGMMSDQPSSAMPADQNAAVNEHTAHHDNTETNNE